MKFKTVRVLIITVIVGVVAIICSDRKAKVEWSIPAWGMEKSVEPANMISMD